jgi:tRNA pseudouridine32 synthase/23S rRNA pseudouridine746 synthase
LRVHLASLGHPILGDELYAGAAEFRADRLLLHATDLSLPHPLTGETLTLHCPVPF